MIGTDPEENITEIGIRKALAAPVLNIVQLLSREIILRAVRILAAFAAIPIALQTGSMQTFKAAMSNPSDTLRC